MRLMLVSVGKAKAGPERDLAAHYVDWAANAGRALGFSPIELRELPESRARRALDRQAEEAAVIRAALPAGAPLIVLDERGKSLDSPAFAGFLARARDDGTAALALVIGGPDGVADGLRTEAALVLAFGAMTWPHRLVRIMAAEQLYRAMTILAGHPYHRA